MPRRGKQYDIDDRWRGSVKSRLDELGQKAAWLAREAGCKPSLISELLSGRRGGTTYLPEIHKALGWPAPAGPMLSKDDEEILAVNRRLTSEQRQTLRALEKMYDDQNKTRR